MERKNNRRELIVDTAARLFIEQGYLETPVRQIAERVGCTEAALYYHFKEGKQAIFEAVLERHAPDYMLPLQACEGAETLAEFILRFGQAMDAQKGPLLARMQWILSELPKLSPADRNFVEEGFLRFQAELATRLGRFVADERDAEDLAWILISTVLGYGQLFYTLGLETHADLPVARLGQRLVDAFAKE